MLHLTLLLPNCFFRAPDSEGISGLDEPSAIMEYFGGEKPQPLVSRMLGHWRVTDIAALGSKWIAACGTDGMVKVFDVSEGQWKYRCVALLRGHVGGVRSIACFPDVRVITGGDDGLVRVWDLAAQTCTRELKGHTAPIRAVLALPASKVASGGDDGSIRIWDLQSKICLAILRGHGGQVLCVALTKESSPGSTSQLISGGSDKTVRLWDIQSKICLRVLSGHQASVSVVLGLPGGRFASGSGDCTIKIWDWSPGRLENPVEGEECVCTLEGHTKPVTSLLLALSGRLVSGSADQRLVAWNLADLPPCGSGNQGVVSCAMMLAAHADGVVAVAEAPGDERGLVTAGSRRIKLWNDELLRRQVPQQLQTAQKWTHGEAKTGTRSSSTWSDKMRVAGESLVNGVKGLAMRRAVTETAYPELTKRYPSTVGMFASPIAPQLETRDPFERFVDRLVGVLFANRSRSEESVSKTRDNGGSCSRGWNDGPRSSGSSTADLERYVNPEFYKQKFAMWKANMIKRKGPSLAGWIGVLTSKKKTELLTRLNELCDDGDNERLTYIAIKHRLIEEFGEELFEGMKEQVSVDMALREFELTGQQNYFPEMRAGASKMRRPVVVSGEDAEDDFDPGNPGVSPTDERLLKVFSESLDESKASDRELTMAAEFENLTEQLESGACVGASLEVQKGYSLVQTAIPENINTPARAKTMWNNAVENTNLFRAGPDPLKWLGDVQRTAGATEEIHDAHTSPENLKSRPNSTASMSDSLEGLNLGREVWA